MIFESVHLFVVAVGLVIVPPMFTNELHSVNGLLKRDKRGD
jgi:hypothetical protein